MATTSQAGEIQFAEDFALADDRAAALEQLIPGTEDYFYYHCLHHQNLEQFDRVEQLLKQWIKRHNYTDRVREIQHRQALLNYPRHPQESLDYLRQQLNLRFDHQRERLDDKPQLPTRLDPSLISRETLTQRALQRQENLGGFTDSALDWLVGSDLNEVRRRDLLTRLRRPDYPGLAQLIVQDLNFKGSGGFGSLEVHRHLLLDQMDECARLRPALKNESAFVNSYLTKLQPSPDVDWQNDPREHQRYLDRLWDFVGQLAPAHNSLKAHVLYHRLVFDRSQGEYSKQRFMEYLKFPRRVVYINPRLMELAEGARYPADLGHDPSSLTLMPPVRDDEPVVRSYLAHFFLEETTYKAYEPYVESDYLKHLFAETKIVNGLGDAEQWYSMLPPEKFQQLKDRIDLDFAHTSATVFAADSPVSVDLYVKNVQTLIVKVFEINARNFYEQNLREVNTDINLDGLIANEEITHQYDAPPLRRTLQHFDFPGLREPGVYVIDFIGNGKSSRVVVRKGRLHYLVRTSSAGQIFTVLDDRLTRADDATVWMSGRLYTPADDGTIAVPFSTNPGRQPIILSRGNVSSLHFFQHQAEQYQLEAGIFVDRESLIMHETAQAVIRPGLKLNGIPISLSVLEEVELTVTSTDHDGIETKKTVADFDLRENGEATFEFQVPPHLSKLDFLLSAKIQSFSQNKKVDVSASQTFAINEIDRTDKIEDLHLLRVDDGYFVELLGKSGESKPDRPVRLELTHRDFRETVHVTLKTDEAGRVELGPLPDIVQLTASGLQDTSHSWRLWSDRCSPRDIVHGQAGESLRIPYMGDKQAPSRDEVSLLEMRGNTFVEDRFDAVAINDGFLEISGLPAGDYDLWLKHEHVHTRIRLTAGKREYGYALGAKRRLELRGERPLQIARVEVNDAQVRVHLGNHSKFSRVHLLATRFYPAFDPFDFLSRIGDASPLAMSVSTQRSLYMAGRDIGDEYRYIIDRGYARKYHGNMLERPSLLLNPWPIRSTETDKQVAAEGEDFAPAADETAAGAKREALQRQLAEAPSDFANLDFLAVPSVVLINLMPDENGVVTVNRDELGPHQHVHLVAVDPVATVYRSVALPEIPRNPRDLRLAAGLDPEKHYTQQKQVTILGSGGRFELSDIATSKFDTYDSLSRIHALYLTLTGDANLREFGFLLNWPKLSSDQKQEKYSKYACHELNFFLFKKDPEFFDSVVQPNLSHKLHKTFLDHWLLRYDLADYLKPWNYAQLNIVERLLLAQRIDGEGPRAARHVGDLFALKPRDIQYLNRLFDTAVRGTALESDDQLGLRQAIALEEKSRGLGTQLRLGESRKLAADVDFAVPESAPATKAPRPSAGRMMDRAARRQMSEGLAAGDARVADHFYSLDMGRRSGMERLYEKLDKTQEWVENNYYQLPIEQQNADLVTVNAFWNDFAQHRQEEPFVSQHWAEASNNFTEMMFALSILDLPLEAGQHDAKFDSGNMTLTTGSAMVVFHQQIRPASAAAEAQSPILVSQNFFRHGDRYHQVQGERQDKFVTDEFLMQTLYGCQIVVTNPSASQQKVDVLVQIPRGAMPASGGKQTRSVHLDLQPYHTQTVEYYFYFPAAGEYQHFPVHVAKNEQLLAYVEPFQFHVVEQPSRIDRQSWDYVSQFASNDQVLDFLANNNIYELNLERIAFRVQDPKFFQDVTQLLAKRHAYNQTLWSYGLKHDVPAAIREYLQHADGFVRQCGDYLSSELLVIDPVVRKTYQHMDYRPLVNARAHQLGRQRQILNDRFFAQYHRLMDVLSCRRRLDDDDLMSVTYYLLLQDRIGQAVGYFSRVQPDNLETRLQYDYFAAYLDCFRESPEVARAIAGRYANYPVDRWRNTFASVTNLIEEIEGKGLDILDPEDRTQTQTKLAAIQPSFDFTVEAKQVRVDYQNLAAVQVNYYLIDLELLFSRNPFVQRFSGQFSHIRPNQAQQLELPADRSTHVFDLPEALHHRNVLVEIVGAGETRAQAYYSNSLAVKVSDNYGQLQVTDDSTGRPLPGTYIKVYAELQDGRTQFYKDGYTDLRGRFDYTSLNTNELDYVKRFALLVLNEQKGGLVREALPPKR